MALSEQQKMLIAHTYAPLLYFHPEEEYMPIRPEHYIKGCALWEGKPPTDQKSDWGTGPDDGGFPRKPLIPKGGISVDAAEDTEGTADPDQDGVNEWYLGHMNNEGIFPYLRSNSEGELWLDACGWTDSNEVTADTRNERCNREDAIEKFRETGFGGLFSPWYYAEVQETSDLETLMIAMGEIEGKSVFTNVKTAIGEMWVVWYYFLYPIHEEYLRRCEQVFEPAGQRRGDYEGDWNAIGIVIQKPAVLPWENDSPMPQPIYAAYGVRLRGLSKDLFPDLFKQGMIVRPWSETPRLPGFHHPRVFVTKGYHNNYFRDGDQDPMESDLLGIPVSKLTCEAVEAIDEVVNEAKETWQDIGETATDIGLTLTKVIAGAGIGFRLGGPIGVLGGMLGGALAGLAEALSSSNTDDVPAEAIRRGLEREPGAPSHHFGLVIKPTEVPDPLLVPEPEHPENAETAARILNWLGTDEDMLVDRNTQIWWPGVRGYNGRWGVRCADDPNDRRSGIVFPDFRAALMNDLAVHISKTRS